MQIWIICKNLKDACLFHVRIQNYKRTDLKEIYDRLQLLSRENTLIYQIVTFKYIRPFAVRKKRPFA